MSYTKEEWRRRTNLMICWFVVSPIVGYFISFFLMGIYLNGYHWASSANFIEPPASVGVSIILGFVILLLGSPIVAVVGDIVLDRTEGRTVTNRALFSSDSTAKRYAKMTGWWSDKDNFRHYYKRFFAVMSLALLVLIIVSFFLGCGLFLIEVFTFAYICFMGGYVINLKGFADKERLKVPLHLVLGVPKKMVDIINSDEVWAHLDGLLKVLEGPFQRSKVKYVLRRFGRKSNTQSGTYVRVTIVNSKFQFSVDLVFSSDTLEVEIRDHMERDVPLLMDLIQSLEGYFIERGVHAGRGTQDVSTLNELNIPFIFCIFYFLVSPSSIINHWCYLR